MELKEPSVLSGDGSANSTRNSNAEEGRIATKLLILQVTVNELPRARRSPCRIILAIFGLGVDSSTLPVEEADDGRIEAFVDSVVQEAINRIFRINHQVKRKAVGCRRSQITRTSLVRFQVACCDDGNVVRQDRAILNTAIQNQTICCVLN